MNKKKPAKAKRPPLSAYLTAGMPTLRLIARIERAAALPPGSIMADFIDGIDATNQTMAQSWAEWIVDGNVHDDGTPFSEREESALACRIARILGPEGNTALR